MGRLINSIFESILGIFTSVREFCMSGSLLQRGVATVAVVVALVFVFAAFGKK